ncbi:3-hydroxyacyl-CoA dehydrogenase family protein [Caldalkalibacillus salinus]|uniref:3-hydroxyacyl-CoA dehydrogenase family protein n=1 Tax=Caldalkalibacillus salinus TaxID=2803787 RepID=UPI0019228B83|nr:3-hydroxyacyl-CoA dehydrogenase family protein [Caldalkalibacillus salinus]
MKPNNILILGTAPINAYVAQWCQTHQVQCQHTTIDTDTLPADDTAFKDAIESADVIFDTITGPIDIKKRWTQAIDQLSRPDAIILTSFLHHTVTEISSWCQDPSRLIGFQPLHFDSMPVLEIAPGLRTAQDHLDTMLTFFEQHQKQVEIIQDQVGGVFPRTLSLIANEAIYTLSEQVATKEDIDTAMKKGTNYPLGPLEWVDKIGLDHVLCILDGLYRECGDDRYRPAPLLKQMVRAGYVGEVSGKGFYDYA